MTNNDQRSMSAAIEYHGTAGSTAECVEAIECLLEARYPITHARILTASSSPIGHAILLTDVYGGKIAVKSGFTSGYSGTGPRGLSRVIGLLDWMDVSLDEIEISSEIFARVDDSALTMSDLDIIEGAPPFRPARFWDYVLDQDYFKVLSINPWKRSRIALPLALVEDRLIDLARAFWDDPDAALSKAHRRLETIIRARTEDRAAAADDLPTRLFAKAFHGDNPKLVWPGVSAAEQQGRANLFNGTLLAHRNPRAHREGVGSIEEHVSEFLLVNHLFRLEAEAVDSDVYAQEGA